MKLVRDGVYLSMQRVLIADSSKMFCQGVAKQLEKDFLVSFCCDGGRVLRKIIDFDPDIILLDMALPGCDGVTLIENIRMAGGTENIVVFSTDLSMRVQQILAGLGVVFAFSKPCAISNVVCFVRQLALSDPGLDHWNVEAELDNILLRLGFRCGRGGYNCTYEAIRLRYNGEVGFITKCLYAEVRKICGKKSTDAVEKAIRDAINIAWDKGDPDVWDLYFPPGKKREAPSNEVFIARITRALNNHEKLKKPCEQELIIQKEA